jgi:hypothetical protein
MSVVSYHDTVLEQVNLEKLVTNTYCTHICIKILRNNKYDEIMILLYNTIHCSSSIKN